MTYLIQTLILLQQLKSISHLLKQSLIYEKILLRKNETCKEVSKHIRKRLNKKSEYEVGETLICREYINIKKVDIFNVNFKYKIVRVLSQVLRIKHITTGSNL
jgi:hypothetical protein